MQCLDGRKRVLGESDPETVKVMLYLAGVLHSQEKHIESAALYRQCLDKSKAVFGESHEYTLTSLANLAGNLIILTEYSEAEVLLKQCLAKQKAVLGESHPSTFRTKGYLDFLSSKLQSQEKQA